MEQSLKPSAILSGFIGSVCGGVASLYAPDNVVFSAICTTLGGTALIFFQQKVGRSAWKLVTTTAVLGCFIAVSYLCVVDRVSEGVTLVTTKPVALRSTHEVSEDTVVSVLAVGERVRYLARTWRKYRIKRETSSYLDYWRLVELSDGRQGWIYGAYLRHEQ